MSEDIVIKVKGVSKKFCRSLKRSIQYGVQDIAHNMVGLSSKSEKLRKDEFWAVDNVSFEVRKGETLGIIGPNGSGKTTILKMFNGIFMPDKGKIEVKGRVGALIEIGAGFHPMLTGRENIYVNGAILGMSKKEIDEKFDEIVKFADIGDFIDAPVKFYSSGMYVRLGFAVAVHCEPDILLVDEVLAVGDSNFRQKCIGKMADIRKAGKTVVFVTHNMNMARITCQKAVFLNSGKIIATGDIEDVIKTYQDFMSYQNTVNLKKNNAKVEDKSVPVSLLEVKLTDRYGREKAEFRTFEEIRIKFLYQAIRPILNPTFGSGIHGYGGLICYGSTTKIDNLSFDKIEGLFEVELTYESLPLLPGAYFLTAGIWEGEEMIPVFRDSNIATFRVKSGVSDYGIFYMKHKWSINKLTEVSR